MSYSHTDNNKEASNEHKSVSAPLQGGTFRKWIDQSLWVRMFPRSEVSNLEPQTWDKK
jgi:hypothetical protein